MSRRVYATGLLTKPSERRRDRRARRKLEAAARMREARDAAETRKAQMVAEREEAKAARPFPRSGEPRPHAGLAWLPLRVPAHRATSATLAGAYPWLAEAGLGSDGIYIGRDAFSGGSFVYDPWVLYARGVLTNPNALLAGVIGTGKSALAKSLATRSIAFGRRVYVPGDPKGEWTSVAHAVGGQAITLGRGMPTRLNPLDPGPRPSTVREGEEWQRLVWSRRRELLSTLAGTALGRRLQAVEHTTLDIAIRAATVAAGHGTPLLPGVVDRLFEPTDDDAATEATTAERLAEDGRHVAHALRRLVRGDLAGLFDGPSTTVFDPTLPMVTVDLSRITDSDDLLSLVMTCASSWMEAALLDPAGGHRWVVYDEAWRLVRDPALLRRMQSQWKLSRAFGIANLAVIHRLSDLDAVGDLNSEARAIAEGLLADCSTRIIYRQETDQLRGTAQLLGLTDVEREHLPRLGRGVGLWHVADRSFLVGHQLSVREAPVFDTSTRMQA